MLFIVLGILILFFGFIVLRGAPYVPTHRAQVEVALDLLDLKQGDTIVDLGSGDGVVLKAAAERGLIAHGFELNPILCAVSYIRCWRYRDRVFIHMRDFRLSHLPASTKGVFLFSAAPFMKKILERLESEAAMRESNLRLVSYGFKLPGRKADKSRRGLHLYRL